MLSISKIIFSGGLLFFTATLHAEVNRSSVAMNIDSEKINLHQAINKTFEYNPALNVFSYSLKAYKGKQLQAGLSASPEISIVMEDALGSGNFNNTDNAQTTLGIAWVVEGETRQRHIDVATAGNLSLSAQGNVKRLNAAAETARLYINTLANQARLKNAIKTVDLAKATVAAVKKRVKAGKTPAAELSRARAEMAQRQLAHEDVGHELISSIRVLAAQWGETQPSFTRVEGSIFKLPAIISFENLKTKFNQSPEFKRLISEKHLREEKLKLETSQSNSPWNINLGIRHYERTNDQALVAGISMPIGERSRNKGRILEAQENLSQSMAKTDALKVQFETMLYVLNTELQHALHTVDAYRSTIIPQLEKSLKETRRAYNLGRYSYLEWSSVQADLLDARSALIEASVNAHLKVIKIERLTGVPLLKPATQTAGKS